MRFTIRDLFWLMVVVAVGLTGVLWVNRLVYADKHIYHRYLEELSKRHSAETEVMVLQAEIAKLRSELTARQPTSSRPAISN